VVLILRLLFIYLSLIVYCLLFSMYCLLFIVYCLLFIVYCLGCTVERGLRFRAQGGGFWLQGLGSSRTRVAFQRLGPPRRKKEVQMQVWSRSDILQWGGHPSSLLPSRLELSDAKVYGP